MFKVGFKVTGNKIILKNVSVFLTLVNFVENQS